MNKSSSAVAYPIDFHLHSQHGAHSRNHGLIMMDENNPNASDNKIEGVFSTVEARKTGTGMTSRKSTYKQYWVVEEKEGGLAEVTPVNDKLIPMGKPRAVTLTDLLERFEPEPEFLYSYKSYAARQAEEKEKAEAGPEPIAIVPEEPEITPIGTPEAVTLHIQEDDEFTYRGTPEDVEKGARSSFGLGVMHLRQGNIQKARDVFESLSNSKGDFVPVHKHMFNEFAITLRKEQFFDLALKHYFKALGLGDNDEHLHFNIARSYYDNNEYANCVRYIEKSLAINPGLKESGLFMRFMKRKHSEAFSPLKLDF